MKSLMAAVLCTVVLVCFSGCLDEITSPDVVVISESIDFSEHSILYEENYVALKTDNVSRIVLTFGEMYIKCTPTTPNCWPTMGRITINGRGSYDQNDWQAFYNDRSGSLPTIFEFHPDGFKISADRTTGIIMGGDSTNSSFKVEMDLTKEEFDKIFADFQTWNDGLSTPLTETIEHYKHPMGPPYRERTYWAYKRPLI